MGESPPLPPSLIAELHSLAFFRFWDTVADDLGDWG